MRSVKHLLTAVEIRRRRPTRWKIPPPGCWAPLLQLHFLPTGEIRACCESTLTLGRIGPDRLPDIWAGTRRRELASALAVGDHSMGCQSCEAQAAVEGRSASYAGQFDLWADRLDATTVPAWPLRMEFELSNRCNLQCIQCSGDLSSSIRAKREHRPPLPAVYDDRFFDDLAMFIPHLRHANFAGGEPFLAPENHRVWDLIRTHNPTLPITICTNGTVLTDRVQGVLDDLQVDLIVSIDGATAETYERVRQDGDYATVLANLDRLATATVAKGTSLQINFCLLVQNIHEFGAMLRMAEDRGISVNALPVRGPAATSLFHLPADRLAAIVADLDRESAALRPTLELNAPVWERELARLHAWLDAHDTDHAPTTGMILMFPQQGGDPVDELAIRGRLTRRGAGQLASATVGQTEVITEVDESFAALFQCSKTDLLGHGLEVLLDRVTALRDADSSDIALESRSFVADTSDQTVQLVLYPVRGSSGTATEVRVLALVLG